MTDDERFADWLGWYEEAKADVTTLFHQRHIWRNLLAMLGSNPEIQHHAVVNEWLARSYSQTLAVGVRRQSEYGERRPTIARLLHEIATHPGVLTFSRYRDVEPGQPLASVQETWSRYAAQDSGVDSTTVRADLGEIVSRCEPARRWVNQGIAHRGRDIIDSPLSISFDELHAGLDTLGATTKKYFALFHPGQVLYRVTPDTGLQWTEMFAVPWRSDHFVPIPSDDLG